MTHSLLTAAILALLLSFCLQQSASLFELQDTTCGLEYQHILTEAIELRKECNNAAFRDCCQVHDKNLFVSP